MKALFFYAFLIFTLNTGFAGCENSTLVLRANRGTPIKVYIDGETGSNPATPAVTVRELTPGSHLLKVVSVITDSYGRKTQRLIYNGTIQVHPSKYMDAHVEEHVGVRIHETAEACGDRPRLGPDEAYNGDNSESISEAPSSFNPGSKVPLSSGPSAEGNTPGNMGSNAQQSVSSNNPSIPSTDLQPETMRRTMQAGMNLPQHISESELERIKMAIDNSKYEIKKMDTLKALVAGYQFASSQVGELMNLFAFESDKLSIAKLLYSQTVDPEHYQRLASYFNFDARKEDFKKFMAGK